MSRETMQIINFEKFASAADAYCELIQTPKARDEDEFSLQLQASLIELYSIALNFPEIMTTGDCVIAKSDPDFDSYRTKISELIPFQYYWLVLEPFDHENVQAGCGDLLDDISDIYKDLKGELSYLQSNDSKCRQHGTWMIKFDFNNHWGTHAINALNALHEYNRKL